MSPSFVSLLTFIPLLVLTSLPQLAIAIQERNVTVDDNDSSISYRGIWVQSEPSAVDYQGTHQYSVDGSATATFTFTGTAVYMLSPKWPYEVNTAVSLDGGRKVTIDLLDPSTTAIVENGPETLKYDVVWSATSLTNTSHAVIVSRADNVVVVDGFIYTQTSPDESSSSSQGSTSTSSVASANTSSSETGEVQSASLNGKVVPIALATTFGVLALLAIVAVIILLRRRREKKQRPPSISSAWENGAFAPQFHPSSGGGGEDPRPWSRADPATSPTPSPGFSPALPIVSAYAGYSSVPTGATGITADSHENNITYSTVRGPYDPHPIATDATSATQLHPYAIPHHGQPHRGPSPSSSQAFLRAENSNTETNTTPQNFSSLSYSGTSDDTSSGQVTAQNSTVQGPNRYLSSQEEKAALYQANNVKPARSLTPSTPPAYEALTP